LRLRLAGRAAIPASASGDLAPGPVSIAILTDLARDGGVGGAGHGRAGGNDHDTHTHTHKMTPVSPPCAASFVQRSFAALHRLIRRSRRNHGKSEIGEEFPGLKVSVEI